MSSKLLSVFLISLISAFIIYVLFFITPKNIVESDYVSFVTGAEIVRSGEGDKLYDLETQQKVQKEILGDLHKNIFLPYRNLPFVTLLFIPLLPFGLIAGYKIFAIINILLLIISLYVVAVNNKWSKDKTSLILISAFLFSGNILAIFYGQLSIVLLTIFVCIYISISQNKVLLTGIYSSLILLKPQYILALPFIYFMAKKMWVYLGGLVVSAGFLLLISVFLTNIQLLESYKNLIIATENSVYGARAEEMYSLPALMVDLNYKWIVLAAGYIICLSIFFSYYKKKTTEENFIFLIIISLLVSPHTLGSDLSLLLLPIIFLIKKSYGFLISSMLFFLPISAIFVGRNLVLFNSLILLTLFAVYIKRSFITQNLKQHT